MRMGTILTSIRPPRGDSDDTLQDLVDGGSIGPRLRNPSRPRFSACASTIGGCS